MELLGCLALHGKESAVLVGRQEPEVLLHHKVVHLVRLVQGWMLVGVEVLKFHLKLEINKTCFRQVSRLL